MVELGKKYMDPVSGFIGIAVSRHTYLDGCNRISLQAKVDKDGKVPESVTFDEPRLLLVDGESIIDGEHNVGGPDKYIDEGR